MKKFVSTGILAAMAALLLQGTAVADAQAKKRKPTFLEQIFGNSGQSDSNTPRKRRNVFGGLRDESIAGDNTNSYFAEDRSPAGSRRGNVTIADADPEDAVPGLGMGNLTYVPPKLVALSGISLPGAAPGDPAAAAIYAQLGSDSASLRVLPAARAALLAQYASQSYRPIWLADGKLSERGRDVLKLLASAGDDGLQPQTYLPTGLSGFDAPLPENDPAAMARLDIDLSAAALRYAHDASGGQFDPALLSRYNDLQPPWVPADKAIRVIANSPYPVQYLRASIPPIPPMPP